MPSLIRCRRSRSSPPGRRGLAFVSLHGDSLSEQAHCQTEDAIANELAKLCNKLADSLWVAVTTTSLWELQAAGNLTRRCMTRWIRESHRNMMLLRICRRPGFGQTDYMDAASTRSLMLLRICPPPVFAKMVFMDAALTHSLKMMRFAR